jgi:hypothetical protein
LTAAAPAADNGADRGQRRKQGVTVDEAKWLKSRDPRLLYAHARRVAMPVYKSGRRRLRLYACACCRRVWHLLAEEGRAAVEVAERFADDRANLAELRQANAAARQAHAELRQGRQAKGLEALPADPAKASALREARRAAMSAAYHASGRSITSQGGRAAVSTRLAEGRAAEDLRAATAHGLFQCELLRDLFGNPFRPVQADPAWLRRNDGAVGRVARALYDEGAFDRLAVLADALEDAGCGEEALLAHLRGPGPHVRGCWALDLLREGTT